MVMPNLINIQNFNSWLLDWWYLNILCIKASYTILIGKCYKLGHLFIFYSLFCWHLVYQHTIDNGKYSYIWPQISLKFVFKKSRKWSWVNSIFPICEKNIYREKYQKEIFHPVFSLYQPVVARFSIRSHVFLLIIPKIKTKQNNFLMSNFTSREQKKVFPLSIVKIVILICQASH